MFALISILKFLIIIVLILLILLILLMVAALTFERQFKLVVVLDRIKIVSLFKYLAFIFFFILNSVCFLDGVNGEELSPTSDGIETEPYSKKKIIALIFAVVLGAFIIYYFSLENSVDISTESSSSSAATPVVSSSASSRASTPDIEDREVNREEALAIIKDFMDSFSEKK